MHPDDIDVTASGEHEYSVTLADRTLRVPVDPELLGELGLTAVQEPLLLRRVVEGLPETELASLPETVDLRELGRRTPGFPELMIARLRT